MDPWGRPHMQGGGLRSRVDRRQLGWMAGGPAAKQRGKANRNKVVETKKHGKAIIRTRGGESSLHTT